MPFFRLQFFRFLGAPVLIALLGLLPSQAAAETLQLQPYSNNPILAIVDGEPVILDDLKNAEIHEAMVQLYQMQTQVLKEKILEKLSVKHPKLKPDGAPLPTQDDIVQFYKDTPGVRALGTIEKMQGEIRAYLEKVFQNAYVEERYQLALKKGWAKVYLQPPLEFTLEAAVGTAKLWFEKDDEVSRRVFLLEYSDFQCPFCKRVQGTLDRLRKHYDKEVQFGYRHFPMDFHKEAKIMAESVECARDQGRFWELQKLLYEHSGPVQRSNLHQYAKRAGVPSMRRFQTCLKERKYKGRILKDLRDGMKLGIQGTPTFILGTFDPETRTVSGELMSGAVSEEKFSRAIEKYLSITRAEANLAR